MRRDLDDVLVVYQSTNHDTDISVTSILAPTLKGHLLVKSIDSNKSFKDQVLVLVKHKRRLYQFDADNAQHPKQVWCTSVRS